MEIQTILYLLITGIFLFQFSSVKLLICDPMDCSISGFPVHHQLLELLKLTSIESVMPSKH